MITLYTWGTPNGRKISIMLEAIGADYQVVEVDITKGQQFEAEFLSHSPNNKIPAIYDTDGPNGKPISLFESGAILLYLAQKSGQYLPSEPRQQAEVMQWLMWQMGGFGPFLGQAHHFNRFAPEAVPYAVERYNKEAARLWQVLDQRLAGREFVCDQLSIADFAIYPWSCRAPWQLINSADYPNVHAWMQRLAAMAFVEKGMAIAD